MRRREKVIARRVRAMQVMLAKLFPAPKRLRRLR